MKEGKLPKLELSMNHVLITASVKEASVLITGFASDRSKDPTLLPIQKVLAVGPFCTKENGICYNVGDTVRIDDRKIAAKNSFIIGVTYDISTGKVILPLSDDKVEDKNIRHAFVITDREILYKIIE